ncbi:S66 peptidase family protein [Terriglobus saanensis]|uniref:Peptidase U61 LD-carboxypeptidase A n=1 Tax=Terriglobus saanensis (strain ATCC BAA-1853 / DSM 23119 / SP1PR4) TaxID=401053 RepID=E8V5L4_TERSS|nr:LD-carboxypeptidase [Terriglobus saanensis]ADV81548.1 peptidase U61 LD-carboxypeptidase A [Terriglobus saanensis SP1PR4]
MKLRALRAGGRIAVISPASAPKAEAVERGVERLCALGYEVVLGEHALARGPLYYAGDVKSRVADLHAAFADPTVDAIVCTRGGWGSAELLPHLDAELIRTHAKPFVGYSDHTSLAIWLQNEVGFGMFYGPMVSADFACGRAVEESVDLASWRHALQGDAAWGVGAMEGMRMLRPGDAEGVLFGGCISILAESLGTPYALRPPSDGGVLFLEDVGTKPYQWDRLLVHLRYAGVLDAAKGIVFGDMEQCADVFENELLEQAILHSLRDFAGPIAIGLRCGHVYGPNVTLPLGAKVRLSAREVRLEILEAVVG